MPTTTTKSPSSRAIKTRPQQKNKPRPAQPAIALRCAVCGNMDLDDAFDHHPVTMDGIRHNLAMCKSNGACTYQAQLLAERLEFREIDGAPVTPLSRTPARLLFSGEAVGVETLVLEIDAEPESLLLQALAKASAEFDGKGMPDSAPVGLICKWFLETYKTEYQSA